MCPQFLFVDTNSAHKDHHPESLTSSTHGHNQTLTKLAERGGKNTKKRAVVAVARKLAVLLHRLWVSGEVYEPLRNSQRAMRAVA